MLPKRVVNKKMFMFTIGDMQSLHYVKVNIFHFSTYFVQNNASLLAVARCVAL